jgi:hypothetical protein
MSQSEHNGIQIIKVRKLISIPRSPDGVGEIVFAEISNDYFGTNTSVPVFGGEFRYRMEGKNLEGPIPTAYRTGFQDANSAGLAAELELRQWRAGDIPEGTKMPRESVWRTRYRRKRYLAAFPDEVLVKRFADLTNLSLSLKESNKIGMRHHTEPDAEYISEVQTHILEEFVLRRHKHPYPMDKYFMKYAWPLPDYSADKLVQADSAWEGIKQGDGKYLIKYGKLKYLEPFFETGVTRIAPATIYLDPSLNPSIRDDELTITGFAKPPFSSPSPISNDPNDESFGSGTLKFTFEANSNFYVYCLAGIYDRRLLSDFDHADCFLVIKEPLRFCQDLLDAGMLQLGNVTGKSVPVKYFDPFNVDPSNLNPYTAKDFRYSFQAEYRLFWIPNVPTRDLEPINIQIPRIRDYCELVRLTVPGEPRYLGREPQNDA